MIRQTLIVVAAGLAGLPAQAQTYSVQELPPLPGQNRSYAMGINDAGVVVGQIGTVNGLFPAARWVADQPESLGSLGSYPYALARDINNAGQVIGICYSAFNDAIPFVWETGVMAPLPMPAGFSRGEAWRIDEQGRITGNVYIGPSQATQQPCLWQKLGNQWSATLLATAPYPGGNAIAINSAGAVSGYVVTGSTPPFLAAIWNNGLTTPQFGPPGSGSGVWDIDDSGRILAGYAPPLDPGTAVLRDGQTDLDLGHIGGYMHTFAYRMNGAGTIIGHVYNGDPYSALGTFIDCQAFVWRSGEIALINGLLTNGQGVDVRQVWDINTSGQIAGLGAVNGIPNYRAFRLTACPANCDNSLSAPILNVADFVCFLNRFAAGDRYADCDHSGVLNVNDFVCFQGQFAAGCP